MRKLFAGYRTILITAMVVGLVAGGAVGLIVSMRKPTYDATATWTIAKNNVLSQENADYYLYDRYYNALATEQYADGILGWFSSPALVEQIYQQAQVTLPTYQPSKVGKLIRVTKRPPANLTIRFRSSAPEEATRLAQAAYEIASKRLQAVSGSQSQADRLEIISSAAFTSINQINPFNTGLLGAVGAALSVIVLWGTILYIVKE